MFIIIKENGSNRMDKSVIGKDYSRKLKGHGTEFIHTEVTQQNEMCREKIILAIRCSLQ